MNGHVPTGMMSFAARKALESMGMPIEVVPARLTQRELHGVEACERGRGGEIVEARMDQVVLACSCHPRQKEARELVDWVNSLSDVLVRVHLGRERIREAKDDVQMRDLSGIRNAWQNAQRAMSQCAGREDAVAVALAQVSREVAQSAVEVFQSLQVRTLLLEVALKEEGWSPERACDLGRTHGVLLALTPWESSLVGSFVLSWGVLSQGEKHFLQVPRVVATWLEGRFRGHVIESYERVEESVVETALALWEPREDGVLRHAWAALEAARSVAA